MVDNVTEEILIANIRTNTVNAVTDLKSGNLFYITCIDKPHKLKPLYEKYKDVFHCVYHTEMYTNEQWLEIMPGRWRCSLACPEFCFINQTEY